MLSRYQQSRSSLFSWIPVADFFLVTTVFLMMCLIFVVGAIPADKDASQTERLRNELKKRDIAIDSSLSGGVSLKTQIDNLLKRFDELRAESQTERLRNELKKRDIAIDSFLSGGVSLKTQIDSLLKRFDELRNERDRFADSLKGLEDRNSQLVAESENLKNDFKGIKAKIKTLRSKLDEADRKSVTLHSELKRKQRQLDQYEVTLKRANERILKPLDSARVVVKIRTSLPRDAQLDLDLYVQDPENNLCFWKQLRVFTELGEQAAIIPSEDLRILQDLNRPGDLPQTEEKYYAAEPILKRSKKPYLIFAMLREIGAIQGRAVNQVVEWEVIVKYEQMQVVAEGEMIVRTTGAVTFSKKGERYQGLVALVGFDVEDDEGLKIKPLLNKDLPPWPRGWGKSPDKSKNEQPLRKLRDLR